MRGVPSAGDSPRPLMSSGVPSWAMMLRTRGRSTTREPSWAVRISFGDSRLDVGHNLRAVGGGAVGVVQGVEVATKGVVGIGVEGESHAGDAAFDDPLSCAYRFVVCAGSLLRAGDQCSRRTEPALDWRMSVVQSPRYSMVAALDAAARRRSVQ